MKTLRRRVLDYGLATALLLFPCAILYSSLKEPHEINGFDEAVLRVSSPLQAAADWAASGIGGLWNDYVWLVDVEDENDELRADNERLREQLAESQRLVRDTETLEALIQLRRRTSAETIGARVVSTSLNPYFRVVRMQLDRGADTAQPHMPVINSDGLVGRVHAVYGNYSDVLLITDPQSSIDVIISRTRGRGVLTGLAQDDAYRAKIEYLERDKQVQIGDAVVTSGLGRAVPPGIPVGVIASVKTTEYGMYQEVEVRPAVDFSTLKSALILLAPPLPPDPNADRPLKSVAAFGATPF